MLRLSDDGLSAVPMLVGEMLGEMPSSETMLLIQELLLILIKIKLSCRQKSASERTEERERGFGCVLAADSHFLVSNFRLSSSRPSTNKKQKLLRTKQEARIVCASHTEKAKHGSSSKRFQETTEGQGWQARTGEDQCHGHILQNRQCGGTFPGPVAGEEQILDEPIIAGEGCRTRCGGSPDGAGILEGERPLHAPGESASSCPRRTSFGSQGHPRCGPIVVFVRGHSRNVYSGGQSSVAITQYVPLLARRR